jgi:tetratricopeptide (TPR) repeat protein
MNGTEFIYQPVDENLIIIIIIIIAVFSLLLCLYALVKSFIKLYKNIKFEPTKREKGNDFVTMMKLGRAFYNIKNYEAAIGMYTDTISLNPNHGLAYYNRGVVHYKLNNYMKAGNDFISAAKLGHKKSQRLLKAEKQQF